MAATKASCLRYGDRRGKKVRLLGGGDIYIPNLIYLKPNYRSHGQGKRNKKKQKKGKKSGVGMYPALAALGIEFAVTPALGGEIARQVTDSDSVRAGRSSLARRDIDFGHKQTLQIVNAFSHRAVEQRNQWLEAARQGQCKTGPLKGKRVVISTDGGRARHRNYQGKRRKANGHRNYQAEWREPKVLTIYVVNAKGKLESEFRPIYDGTMNDCDALFSMLIGYLRALGIHEAKELIIVADGAKWIWERVDTLIQACVISANKVHQVVDWYHAVEKLNAIGGVPKKWPSKAKDKWIRKAKDLLYKGKIKKLIDHIEGLATGRRAESIRKHEDYFIRNTERMQYESFVNANIPIGSGAMESAVRRIVNLRLKSNAKFWLEINSEGMLMLRSYLKSGRYDDLINWSISNAASWWVGNDLCVPQGEFSLAI